MATPGINRLIEETDISTTIHQTPAGKSSPGEHQPLLAKGSPPLWEKAHTPSGEVHDEEVHDEETDTLRDLPRRSKTLPSNSAPPLGLGLSINDRTTSWSIGELPGPEQAAHPHEQSRTRLHLFTSSVRPNSMYVTPASAVEPAPSNNPLPPLLLAEQAVARPQAQLHPPISSTRPNSMYLTPASAGGPAPFGCPHPPAPPPLLLGDQAAARPQAPLHPPTSSTRPNSMYVKSTNTREPAPFNHPSPLPPLSGQSATHPQAQLHPPASSTRPNSMYTTALGAWGGPASSHHPPPPSFHPLPERAASCSHTPLHPPTSSARQNSMYVTSVNAVEPAPFNHPPPHHFFPEQAATHPPAMLHPSASSARPNSMYVTPTSAWKPTPFQPSHPPPPPQNLSPAIPEYQPHLGAPAQNWHSQPTCIMPDVSHFAHYITAVDDPMNGLNTGDNIYTGWNNTGYIDGNLVPRDWVGFSVGGQAMSPPRSPLSVFPEDFRPASRGPPMPNILSAPQSPVTYPPQQGHDFTGRAGLKRCVVQSEYQGSPAHGVVSLRVGQVYDVIPQHGTSCKHSCAIFP